MTTATDASGPAPGEWVRMARITSDAAKRRERLSAMDRRRVEKAIESPVHRSRCRLLNGMGGLRVFHYDASRSLRVTFRFLGGRACVLHVGTHPDFEKFVAGYVGDTSNRRLSIEGPTHAE